MINKDVLKIAQSINKELKCFPEYLFIVIKGQAQDIIDGRSDLDFRIVVNTDSILRIDEINNFLSRLYRRIIKNSLDRFRILEHTPLVLSYKVLLKGLGNSNEVATWSFMGGDRQKFKEISDKYASTKVDIRRIMSVISSKKNYNVFGELFYEHLDKEEQKKYCLVWHYYATSIYAFMCIYLQKRLTGKTQGLLLAKKYLPELNNFSKRELLSFVTNKELSAKLLFSKLKKQWKKFAQIILANNTSAPPKEDAFFDLSVYYFSMVLSVNKISRLNVYLSKSVSNLNLPQLFIKKLIKREIEDGFKILNGYNSICNYVDGKNLTNSYQTKILQEKIYHLEKLLLSLGCSMEDLRNLLIHFRKNTRYFQKLFYKYLLKNI